MKKVVIVAGHSCLDITPVFPQSVKDNEKGELLTPGSLIEMEGVEISAGGAVSNTGIAMKLLGADVKLLTKTGEDEFGNILKNIYGKYGVSEGVLTVAGERTSYSAVLAIPGTDRIFLHDPGCNHTFSIDDIMKSDFTDAKLFHFGYPPLMKCMYQNDGKQLIETMKYVQEKGVATSLDMAAVDPNSEAGKIDWDKILKNLLPYVDIFVPSVEELCFMLDRPRFEQWVARAQGKEIVEILELQDIEPLAEKCMDYGVKILIIKCGAPGLYYRTASTDALKELKGIIGIKTEEWGNHKGFELSYVPTRVLSGTGAGDTTIAAFLTAMLSDYSLDMSVKLAAAQGASCVEAYGALGGIRSLEDLQKKIDAGWEKRNVGP